MRFSARVAGLARWLLVDPRAVWSATLVPLGAVAASTWFPLDPEGRFRAAGFLMTLAGVALVAHGIAQTQRQFMTTTIRSRAIQWAKRLLPLLMPARPIHGSGAVTLPMFTVQGHGSVRVVPENPLSVESRIEAIEQNLKRIDERMTQTESRFEADLRAVTVQLQKHSDAHRRDLEAVRLQVKEQSTGNLDWEIVGAVWVVVGQLMDSFSPELATLVK